MEIDGPQPGDSEDITRQDAKRDNDDQIGMDIPDVTDKRLFRERCRLKDSESAAYSEHFDRGGRKLLPPPPGLVRSGDDRCNGAAAVEQHSETGDSEVRRPHEDDAGRMDGSVHGMVEKMRSKVKNQRSKILRASALFLSFDI